VSPLVHVPQPKGSTAGEKPEQWGYSERLHLYCTLALMDYYNSNGNNAGRSLMTAKKTELRIKALAFFPLRSTSDAVCGIRNGVQAGLGDLSAAFLAPAKRAERLPSRALA
jgi:hypothetical protein